MVTLSNLDIAEGVIIYERASYPEAKLVIKEGVSVNEGDLIQINQRYRSDGTTAVIASDDGYTVNGTKQFKDDNATFQTDGAAANDIIWIKEGTHKGFYKITSVDSETQLTLENATNFTSSTGLDYEIWIAIIFKGRIVDKNFEKVKTILCESEAEEIDKPIEAVAYCGRLGGLVQELLDHECAYINHDFTQSTPYIYRAPWNWRNDTIGNPPSGWTITLDGGGAHVQIISDLDGHSKVCELKATYPPFYGCKMTLLVGTPKSGIVEFYARCGGTNINLCGDKKFRILDSDGNFVLALVFEAQGYLYGSDVTESALYMFRTYAFDTWYKVKIQYDIDSGKYECWIDGTRETPVGGLDLGTNGKDAHQIDFAIEQGYGTADGEYFYIDAYGDTGHGNYIASVFETKEYNELLYTNSEFHKIPMTEKTTRQYFNAYADKYQKVWYVDPNYLLIINDGDVDSGIDIGTTSNVANIDGKKQVKQIDKVVLKGGIVNGVRLISVYGSGNVIAKDTYAHILNQDDLNDMAQKVYASQSGGILSVTLDYSEPQYGYIQIGEEITIIGNSLRFSKSEDYICTSDTQFKLRGERLNLGENGVIIYSELYLDDVLLFQASQQEALQKADQENTQLISEVGTTAEAGASAGGGEANTASNQGTGVGVYYQKNGIDLQFNNLKSENNRLSVALDGVTHDVEFTINEANFNLANLGGELGLAQLGSYAAGGLIYGGASDWAVLAPGTEGYVLKMGATYPIWGQLSLINLSDVAFIDYVSGHVLIANGTNAFSAGVLQHSNLGGVSASQHHVKYTDEEAQDAVGGILDDGTVGDIIFTYDDVTPKLSGVVEDNSHNHVESNISDLVHDATKIKTATVDPNSVGLVDGKIMVYRTAAPAGWKYEDKPASGSTPTLDEVFDQGKIIDGATSLANAMVVGDGSYSVNMWGETGSGDFIVGGFIEGVNRLHIRSSQLITILPDKDYVDSFLNLQPYTLSPYHVALWHNDATVDTEYGWIGKNSSGTVTPFNQIYANAMIDDDGTLGSYSLVDDFQLLRDLREWDVREKALSPDYPNVKQKVWDMNTLPWIKAHSEITKLAYDDNKKRYALSIGARDGFYLSVFKKIIEKLDNIELRIQNLEKKIS